MTRIIASDRIKTGDCAHETGDHWVPGGGGRRIASGPEGSSAKVCPPGAQEYLVVVGLMGTILYYGMLQRIKSLNSTSIWLNRFESNSAVVTS